MINRGRWIIAGYVLFLAACAPVHVRQDKDGRISSLSLAISKNTYVVDQKTLKPVFGEGNGAEQLHRFLSMNLPGALADSGKFDRIVLSSGEYAAKCVRRKMPWKRKDTLEMALPDITRGQHFDSTDCTLFIQDISLYGKSLFNYQLLLGKRGSFNIKPLTLHAVYCLWDNGKNEPVKWGKFSSGRKIAVEQCDWVLMLREFAASVVRDTRFKKPGMSKESSHIDSYAPKIDDCNILK